MWTTLFICVYNKLKENENMLETKVSIQFIWPHWMERKSRQEHCFYILHLTKIKIIVTLSCL